MRSFTPAQFAAHLARLATEAPAKEHLGRTLIGRNTLRTIKAVLGDNQKLTDLAEATQAERARLGFTPNDPTCGQANFATRFVRKSRP